MTDLIALPTAPPQRARLGEELPIFCEKCGYSLHGAPPTRCGQCQLLHFACPECGHHQPINTLRPAAQKFLGRLRATWLLLTLFFKINFLFWALVLFFGLANDEAYGWDRKIGIASSASPYVAYQHHPETMLAFLIMGVLFGLSGRVILFRWKRSILIALVLAGLVALAMLAGMQVARMTSRNEMPDPSYEFMILVFCTSGITIVGALLGRPFWIAIVRIFLPRSAADALLNWQTGDSDKRDTLARE